MRSQQNLVRIAASLLLAATAGAQTTVRVSEGTAGVEGNGSSGAPDVSADGRHVVFSTNAASLGAPAGTSQILARDRDPDGNGVFDEGNATTKLVSQNLVGAASNGASGLPSVSGDGRYVAYQSSATDLIANDLNGRTDIFITDRDPDGNGLFEVGSFFTRRIGTALGASPVGGHSLDAHISLDGRYVTFVSQATNMVLPDGNGTVSDIFRYDRWTNQLVRANSTPAGNSPNGPSSRPELSGDGARVVFQSVATDIVAGPLSGFGDLYCRDFANGGMALMNKDSAGNLANGVCDYVAISADGDTIAFSSHATNLDPRDSDQNRDVYVRTLSTGVTELVSLNSLGVKAGTSGTIAGHEPSLSSDGSVVSFWSRSENLYYNQNVITDVYVHDRGTGQTVVASVDDGGYSGNLPSGDFGGNVVSPDGTTAVFTSGASNLIGNDTNGLSDVYAHTWCYPALDFGNGRVGSSSFTPVLEACGGLATGQTLSFRLRHAPPTVRSAIHLSNASNPRPWMGGTLVPAQPLTRFLIMTDANGEASFTLNAGGGQIVFAQWVMRDVGIAGLGFSNALCAPMLP
jgi:Tol biopolymer transport system component